MSRKYLTASDLFNFKKCYYRPYMDLNGDPNLKVDIHPLVKLLWESGVQYEAQVVEAYKLDHSDKSFRAIGPKKPTSEELAADTVRAMKDGVDIIYQGVLISTSKIGRPDFLLKAKGPSSFGDYHYYPMDIKLTREDATWDDGKEKASIEQFWQLYFYGEILESVQGKRPSQGYIFKTKTRTLPVSFGNPPTNYEWAKKQIEAYLQGNANGAEPAINSNCVMCEWKTSCAKWAEEKRDISLVHYVGQAMKMGLNKVGIKTIEDLARQDPKELTEKVLQLKNEGAFWKSMPEDLPRKAIDRAKIYLSGKPALYEEIVFPMSSKEIHFDIEDDPTQDFIYLHGALLVEVGKDPTYHAFFAESREDESAIAQNLFTFFAAHQDALVYHYSDYERTALKRLVSKYKIDSRIFERLFGENGTAIDLYKVITRHTDWPLTSYGIKPICKFLGYQWAASDAGGAASIVWMNEYLAGDKNMKEKILRYNEDDCRATYFLKNELMKMQKDGNLKLAPM